MRERLVQQALPEGSPRRSLFAVTPEMPATEQAARTRIESGSPALYHFGNHNVESALGHHPGLYGDMVVKRRDRSRHAFSSVVGIEREVLVMVLSSRWLSVAPRRGRRKTF